MTNTERYSVKAGGVTISIRANVWGNWYGYISGKYVNLFMGGYDEQREEAGKWLRLLSQAATLAGPRKLSRDGHIWQSILA
jgi:hypothetical protein